jgi:hypothetical protein
VSIKRETVAERKALPIASGFLDYFPDAMLAVAEVSRVGNEQHHPGEPLHWDKSKSSDEADALLRHLLDRGTTDTDGLRHTAKVAWRAMALLQRELDAEAAAAEEPGIAEGTKHGIDRIMRPEKVGAALGILGLDPTFMFPAHWYMEKPEVYSEPWGLGDGPVYGAPFTGTLTCPECFTSAPEHSLGCPRFTT